MERDTDARSHRGGKRNAKACDYCRAAKARCQPSVQAGVCQKCLVGKRECISRTLARPRRARPSSHAAEAAPLSQPFGPSTTFTIETFVPARLQGDDGYEGLCQLHSLALDKVLDDENDAQDLPTPSQSTTASISSSQSRSSSIDVWRQPRFNTASAQSLLDTFSGMLKNVPFLSFATGSTIPQLAATRPFVLLAILTVTSGASSVQKHSLYDDEFLKILGLTYVSGGERSLELLQGLLIYCAWYPFHLKPKSSQLARCLRMVSDIVHDLGLDENFVVSDAWEERIAGEKLDKLRAYVAYFYLASTYMVVWKGDRYLSVRQTPWVASAIDILEQNAEGDGDRCLATLTRLSSLFSDAADATNGGNQTIRNRELILLGLTQQYQQVQDSITSRYPSISSEASVRMLMAFVDVYLSIGSLLTFPVARTSLSARKTRFAPPAAKMVDATKSLRDFLELAGELDDAAMLSLTVSDWTRLIVVLTLAFRLSFPVALCPEFDWVAAREEIQLEQFLARASRGTRAGGTSSGILAANRAVLGVLQSKYTLKLGSHPETCSRSGQMSGSEACPVFHGGGGLTIRQWDTGLTEAATPYAGPDMPEMLPMLQGLWATGGLAWQDVNEIAWDSFGEQFGGGTGEGWPK